MVKLATFGKVRIEVRGLEHGAPHFHVIAADFAAVVAIDPPRILRGEMPASLWAKIRPWAIADRAALIAAWNALNPNLSGEA